MCSRGRTYPLLRAPSSWIQRSLATGFKTLMLETLEDRRMLSFTVNHSPYIQLGDAPLEGYNGGADRAEILWQTIGTQQTDAFTAEVRQTGTMSWSSASLNAQIITGIEGRIVHSATFTDLNFNEDYDYEITHLRAGSPIATYSSTFRTRLDAGDSSNFTFVTYGDSASGDPPANFISVQNRINEIDPAFSLLLGDNVYTSGTHAEFDLRLDPSKNGPLTTYNKNHIDYFGFGNHDVGYNSGQAARENYSMPIPVQDVTSPAGLVFDANVQEEENYSYDYGDVHFLTFDTNNWTNTAALNKQLDWAVTDISAAKARTNPPSWIIVFGHHPITSLAGHTEHTPDDYYYDQVLSRLGHGPGGVGVDLLLFGHAHNYQRSYPLTGHVGATATYVLDADSNYAKGAGLPLVVQGTGGVGLGYGANDATFSGSYLAKALDSNTSVAAQFGFGKIDVTPTTLIYSYINTLGQVLDTFTIGPPPPDTTPPTAGMVAPQDNSSSDQSTEVNQIIVNSLMANFQVQLNDSGDGVDDATVLAAAISMSKELDPLVQGVDYSFSYDSGTNLVTLTPLSQLGASFANGSYVVSLSAAIEDLAGNPLLATDISILIDTGLPSLIGFQESVGGYSGTLDTYLHEDEPSTTHGGNVKIYSDGDDDLGTSETQAQEVQGLIRFNNLFVSGGGASRIGGPIPDDSTILSATLTVSTGTASGDNSASEFRLHRMIATWDENATWNSLSTGGVGIARDDMEAATNPTAIASGGNINLLGGVVSFDVTADLQLWSSNNTLSLRGWLIHPDSVALGGNTVSGQTDGWWFDSSEAGTVANRPRLTVTYVVPPTNVSAGGPYTIDEGSPLNLSGSATGTGQLAYSWDVNGDDVFGDATGPTPSLTWAQLVALGINNGPMTRNVRVRVADEYDHLVDSGITLLTVNNVAPTADAQAYAYGSTVYLTGVATDPVDAISYLWDINGDGIFGDVTGPNPTITFAQLEGSNFVRLRADDGDGGITDSPPAPILIADPAPVVARHIFYNQSTFDGNNAAISPLNDNAAIASDKLAYLPNGTTGAFNNVTSYSRGINGIMVDISDIPGTVTASDFVFKVGNNNTPSSWAAAPEPSALSVVAGGGVGGSDRVIVTWATGAICNTWLEVQVLANTNTGLAYTDVHFWGNKAGDSGTATPATTLSTTTTDSLQVFASLGGNKPITDLRDYNRDGQVSTIDSLLVFANLGSITRLKVGPGGPFAPEADPAVSGEDRGSAVASALAASKKAPGTADELGQTSSRSTRENSNDPIAGLVRDLAEGKRDSQGWLTKLVKIQSLEVGLALDEELLDLLAVELVSK
jgi:hypothetical protein